MVGSGGRVVWVRRGGGKIGFLMGGWEFVVGSRRRIGEVGGRVVVGVVGSEKVRLVGRRSEKNVIGGGALMGGKISVRMGWNLGERDFGKWFAGWWDVGKRNVGVGRDGKGTLFMVVVAMVGGFCVLAG